MVWDSFWPNKYPQTDLTKTEHLFLAGTLTHKTERVTAFDKFLFTKNTVKSTYPAAGAGGAGWGVSTVLGV